MVQVRKVPVTAELLVVPGPGVDPEDPELARLLAAIPEATITAGAVRVEFRDGSLRELWEQVIADGGYVALEFQPSGEEPQPANPVLLAKYFRRNSDGVWFNYRQAETDHAVHIVVMALGMKRKDALQLSQTLRKITRILEPYYSQIWSSLNTLQLNVTALQKLLQSDNLDIQAAFTDELSRIGPERFRLMQEFAATVTSIEING